MKNKSDGNTNQKIRLESVAICGDSTPSKCIQIIASKEVSGNAAISAAKILLRLAISEISTMINAETQNLNV